MAVEGDTMIIIGPTESDSETEDLCSVSRGRVAVWNELKTLKVQLGRFLT